MLNQTTKARTLCVFNKKSIHGVRIAAGSGAIVHANYLKTHGASRERVDREVNARNIRISALPPEFGGVEFEPFEFFEMGGEIGLDLDPDSGLPLRISGEISGLGRVDFLLSEINRRR